MSDALFKNPLIGKTQQEKSFPAFVRGKRKGGRLRPKDPTCATAELYDFWEERNKRRDETETLKTRPAKVRDLIQKAKSVKYQTPGWDGYNAKPLDMGSIKFTELFLQWLQDEIPLPDFDPQADGDMGLYWEINGNTAVVSINATGIFSFATLDSKGKNSFGDDKNFSGLIPEELYNYLIRIQKSLG